MKMSDRLMRKVWRFRAEETASVLVEFVIMVPILVYGFVSTLQFFNAYRAELLSTKAALTVADMYSRETGFIDATYLNGTRSLLNYLTADRTHAEDAVDFRVSQFFWREQQKDYRVSWSKNRGSRINHTNATLNAMSDKLPVLSDGERMLLIETWTEYEPLYGSGMGRLMGTDLEPIEFSTYVVISPRFAPAVCWNNTPADTSKTRC